MKKRIIATLIDYTIYGLFFIAYINIFGHDDNKGNMVVEGWLTLPVTVFWFLYFVVIEAVNGATLGHDLLYLKVLKVDRRRIGFGQALKRHLLDPVDIMMWGIPGWIAIRQSDKHQRLGDLWAKTIVVDTRDRQQYVTTI